MTFLYYNGNASQLHPKQSFTLTVEDSELGRLCNSMECDPAVTETPVMHHGGVREIYLR